MVEKASVAVLLFKPILVHDRIQDSNKLKVHFISRTTKMTVRTKSKNKYFRDWAFYD